MGSNAFQNKLLSIQSNLLNFAYTLTSNREDAYDLLQDTTLKVLDSEDKYVENVNFKGWAFTIMRNLFINKYRRQSRSVVVIDQSEDLYQLNMSQDSGLDTPEGSINAKEIVEEIRSFPDDLRQPFTMLISGYHYNEIAEHLSLPVGTIKSRIFQARKKLQKRLKDFRYDL